MPTSERVTKLQTEKPTNARRALAAFKAQRNTRKKTLNVVFEHGQLWITDTATGAIWSVVDAEGGSAVDGFDFEQTSGGDDD